VGHACCHHGLAVSPKTQAHHLNCEPRDWLREPAVAPRAAQPGTFRLLDTALAGRGAMEAACEISIYVTALTSLGPYPE
jgi:hypothetical protein